MPGTSETFPAGSEEASATTIPNDMSAMVFRTPLSDLLWRITPPCEKITRLISDSMDRRLNPFKYLLMRLHLMVCKLCERYRAQLLFIRQAIRQAKGRPNG